MRPTPAAGSFRDPAGHVVERDGEIYRVVRPAGEAAYRQLLDSGLYDALASSGRLIPHREVRPRPDVAAEGTVLQPVRLRLVSYPYEWAFSALRDAALLTLSVAREAVRHGMRLKDASAFNVQFDGCRPIFIDTLSFEPDAPGPWPAYRQFCEHFLAPLALMSRCDVRLGKMFRLYPGGMPLALASALLPCRTWLRPGLFLHLHAHAWAESRPAGARRQRPAPRRRGNMLALLDSLDATVRGLSYSPATAWTAYVERQESYSDAALAHKLRCVDAWLARLAPGTVWDLGANTGRFSRLAAGHAELTLALDEDAGCVELLYRQARREGIGGLMPLVFDFTAPSPAIGWDNAERSTLPDRSHADLILALAVVHHLAIARGIPLAMIADALARCGRRLAIEFVPKRDPMAAALLAHRDDVFPEYSHEGFEAAFARRFTLDERVPLEDSARVLYLMTRR